MTATRTVWPSNSAFPSSLDKEDMATLLKEAALSGYRIYQCGPQVAPWLVPANKLEGVAQEWDDIRIFDAAIGGKMLAEYWNMRGRWVQPGSALND